MSVEFWKTVFDWATVVLIALTVFTGAGAIITGNILGKRQAQQIADANERAEKEAKARVAMLAELKWRDFTNEQMDTFVATVKGTITELNVFTLPDPEAARFGFTVMHGLQEAGVKVHWYRVNAPYFFIPGISSTGLTLYESPNKEATKVLSEAFVRVGQATMRLMPENPADQDKRLPAGSIPLSSIPSPTLFIALKQPAFAAMPGYLQTPELKAHKPPWE